MANKILVLKGDGIGPEVVGEALQVLKTVARQSALELDYQEALVGGASLDAHGTPLRDEVLKTAQESDAILLGAVGGPKWDNPASDKRPEQALLSLRKNLNLYANMRTVKAIKETIPAFAAAPRDHQRRGPGRGARADQRNLFRQSQRAAPGDRRARSGRHALLQ